MTLLTGHASDGREIRIDTTKKSVHWWPRGIPDYSKPQPHELGRHRGYSTHICEACRRQRATWGIMWTACENLCAPAWPRCCSRVRCASTGAWGTWPPTAYARTT